MKWSGLHAVQSVYGHLPLFHQQFNDPPGFAGLQVRGLCGMMEWRETVNVMDGGRGLVLEQELSAFSALGRFPVERLRVVHDEQGKVRPTVDLVVLVLCQGIEACVMKWR